MGDFIPSPVEWRSPERVRKAISLFENRKSCGQDKLPPKLLKHLPDNAISLLCKFYDACINTGYTPRPWRESRVVFIPKSGKPDYSQPKAFRPISLTPFLFKTLERLNFWHMQETSLKKIP